MEVMVPVMIEYVLNDLVVMEVMVLVMVLVMVEYVLNELVMMKIPQSLHNVSDARRTSIQLLCFSNMHTPLLPLASYPSPSTPAH